MPVGRPGYQLHLGIRGVKAGVVEVVDISVDQQRSDYVFAGVPGVWSAFNRSTNQMVAGMDAPDGVPVADGGYLATFTLRAAQNVAGSIIIDVLRNADGASPEERTFLFGQAARPIAVRAAIPAEITVLDGRHSSRGEARFPLDRD